MPDAGERLIRPTKILPIQYIAGPRGLISVAHQAVLRLSSVSNMVT